MGKFDDRQIDVIRWAADMLADPNLVVLDTETTGLSGQDEIVEVAVIDKGGVVLLDTLVRPTCGIPSEATAVHGITTADVALVPTMVDVVRELRHSLAGATVLIYNAAYDLRLLEQSLAVHGIGWDGLGARRYECLMEQYSIYWGDWNNYYGNYKWQRLTAACFQQRVGCDDLVKAHRALGDCQRTLRLLQKLASYAGELD